MAVMAGSVAVGRQEVAVSLYPYSVERERLEKGWASETLKPTPQGRTSDKAIPNLSQAVPPARDQVIKSMSLQSRPHSDHAHAHMCTATTHMNMSAQISK